MTSDFTQDEKTLIFAVIIVGAILSIIGSGAIILNTILFNNFRGKNKIWNRTIFFLSLCDLCGSIDLLLGRYFMDLGGQQCRFQGLRIQFFFLGSALWTAAIASNIFLVVVMNKEIYQIERYEYIYHVVIWGICILTTVRLFFADYHHDEKEGWYVGNATFWCWITNKDSKLRLIYFFGPLWIIFFINLAVYITMKVVFKRRNLDSSQVYAKNSIASRYHLYLLVLIVTWFWGTINRIQNTINKDKPVFVLYLLHAAFTPLQGFLNSIVYFWCTVIKRFIELLKDIQKQENEIREMRRTRYENNEKELAEGNKDGKRSKSGGRSSRSKYGTNDRDLYDNYFVYNPRPSPLHHQRSNRTKERSKSQPQPPHHRHHSSSSVAPKNKRLSQPTLLTLKNEQRKENEEEVGTEERIPSMERRTSQYEKSNEDTLISISYVDSTTPILQKEYKL